MYELAGKVAEERKIKTADSLNSVLRGFSEGGGVRGTLFEEHAGVLAKTLKNRVRLEIVSLNSEEPLVSQEKDILDAKVSLATEYCLRKLEDLYPVLDPDIFRLDRVLSVKDNNGIDRKIQFPLFANAPLDKNSWAFHKKYEFESSGSYRHSEIDFNVESRVPPISREARAKMREFLSDYLQTLSEGMADPIVGPVLLRGKIGIGSMPALYTCWIPSSKEMKMEIKVIDRDPFIVGKAFDEHFLVAQWDVEGEEPYEHYLEEFKKNK